MAETPSHSPPRVSLSETEPEAEEEYWCYHCDKRVAVETVANLPDVVCFDCKNGFVESMPRHEPPSSDPHGSPFLQVLRLIAQQAARNDHAPQLPPPQSDEADANDDDFLRIELDGWDNDDDDDDDEEEEDAQSVELHNEAVAADEEDDVRSVGEVEDEPDEVDRRLRRGRDVLRLHLLAAAARPHGGGPNEALDWAEILFGLEDNSIELRFEMPESDSYVGNPEDYVDADDYEALLQRLAESDSSGRRGAPPASKAAVAELPTVDEASVCAICKDMVNADDDKSKKMPCGHGYHGDCIVPWLSTRNSCPVCRYEMPTDDPEYEEERSKFDGDVRAGASGSAGGVDSVSD